MDTYSWSAISWLVRPKAMSRRITVSLGVSSATAGEGVGAAGTTSGEARSWWVSYLAQKANQQGIELDQLPITPTQVAHVVELIKAGKLTNKLARQAVDGVLAGEGDVDEVVAARGLEVVRDDGAIEAAVDEAIAANPDIVAKYRAGNTKVAGAIVGQVMKATRGKADPGQVNKLIAAKLAE